MADLTALEKRILLTALWADHRILFWVLPSGRWLLPGYPEDVGGALRGLESRGLLAPREGAAPGDRSPNSYVLWLTPAGEAAARGVLPRGPESRGARDAGEDSGRSLP